MKTTKLRYRLESGQPCVDVRIDSIDQLFDNRDPSPFRERDLDPGLAEYLRDASEDLKAQGPFRIVFWLDRLSPPGEVEHAVRSHFEDVLERLRRRSHLRRRTGQIALLIAVSLLVTLLSLAHLLSGILTGAMGAALREGLVIAGWVVMWRPVEVLLYDWIPAWRERKVISRVLHAPIDIRAGTGPSVPGATDRVTT
jgi:hypothetical protein